jgi:hypothetical protein
MHRANSAKNAEFSSSLFVRSDLLRSSQQLLEIGTITDRIPNGVNLQTSYGSYLGRFFSCGFGCLMLSCQYAKGDARGKVLEMTKIVTDYLLLESLKSIRETSFDYVEINPDAAEACNIAACSEPFARE